MRPDEVYEADPDNTSNDGAEENNGRHSDAVLNLAHRPPAWLQEKVLVQKPPLVTRTPQADPSRQHDCLRLLKVAVESSSNAIVIADRDGVITWVNPAFTKLTGYSSTEAIGRRTNILKSGVHAADFYKNIWDTLLLNRVWHGELVNRRKDGILYTEETTITPVQNDDGEITHFVAVRQDVSQCRRTAQTLQESETKFRALFESSRDAILMCDQNAFFDCNQAALDLFGCSTKDQLMLRHPGEFAPAKQEDGSFSRSRYSELMNTAFAEGSVSFEWQHRRIDGSVFPAEVSLWRFELHGLPVLQVLVRDLTERKKLELQLRQSQKMEGIGQLAAGVAHDFNNMLAVIYGNAELLMLSATSLNNQSREFLNQITGATRRAANLTRQLLLFSRKHVLQSHPVALNELVANLSKMLHRIIREDIVMECILDPRLPNVKVDPGLIEQTIVNLVVNARDAMPRGGRLEISTEQITLDEAGAKRAPDARIGTFVCLKVRDTGVGIPAQHLPRIFEPFFTTKPAGQGTGLGLATVYGVVKQHLGWIEVASRQEQGTTMTIFLPAIMEEAKPASEDSSAPPARGKGETILLVEDDASVRKIVSQVLKTFNYSVQEATCAREAIDLWTHANGEIDLLITDMVMPEGVTGRDLAQKLRSQNPDLRVVFMSGYSPDAMEADTSFLHQNKDCFLQKPSTTDSLLKTVRHCLDEGRC